MPQNKLLNAIRGVTKRGQSIAFNHSTPNALRITIADTHARRDFEFSEKELDRNTNLSEDELIRVIGAYSNIIEDQRPPRLAHTK